MATILIGYDVERYTEPRVTREFLRVMTRVHEELQIPSTLFVLGRVVEQQAYRLRPLVQNPLFDIQQHGYSHQPLKTYVTDLRDMAPEELDRIKELGVRPGLSIHRGLSLPAIREEITTTQRLLRERLGVDNIGLTCPFCYYQGLLDRPDVTELLYTHGIRYVRSWGRNHLGWSPTPLREQPFFYDLHGHPDLLEFPIQGWQDVIWRAQYGWDDIDGYVQMLKETLDEVIANEWEWSLLSHDWSSIKADPEMTGLRRFFEYAKAQDGVRFMLYSDYYDRALEQRVRSR